MTSPFTSFQFSCSEDVFNEPIGNSYLPVGRHEVTVASAEIAEGNYGLELILNFEDSLGKKAKKNFSLIAKVHESPGFSSRTHADLLSRIPLNSLAPTLLAVPWM